MPKKIVIWIIDSQQWPRAYLRAELIERGFEAVGYTDLIHAATALRLFPRTRPEVIVLELRDLTVEARLLAAIMRPGIPVILLTGSVEANEPVVKEYNWAAVMKRPISIGAIADKVEGMISPCAHGDAICRKERQRRNAARFLSEAEAPDWC